MSTHHKKESYKKYIEKIKSNKIALKVKIADLEDNLDIKRIAEPTQKDYFRLATYLKYYNQLKKLVLLISISIKLLTQNNLIKPNILIYN